MEPKATAHADPLPAHPGRSSVCCTPDMEQEHRALASTQELCKGTQAQTSG